MAGFKATDILYTPNCVDFEEILQAKELGEVSQSFTQIDKVTQQNAAMVEQAYWIALSRSPESSETELAIKFLDQQSSVRKQTTEADAELLAFADLCQTLMSMNEFVYVD